jgi:hypothetical protein
MLFGGSHLGYGVVIGEKELQKLREQFNTDSLLSEIVGLSPLIKEEITEKCHPSWLNESVILFNCFTIETGTFLCYIKAVILASEKIILLRFARSWKEMIIYCICVQRTMSSG